MQKQKKNTAEFWITGCLILLAAAATFIRLFFGTEITDEALYVGDAYITLQGAVPVVNNWTQFAPFTLVAAPILKLFFLFSDSTAGIMLYTRIAYFVCKLLLLLTLCLLLRKWFPLRMLIPAGVIILIPSYANISNSSYTSSSYYCLLLSGVFMTAAMLEPKASRKPFLLSCAAGFFSAVSAMVYPTHVITCALLALCLLVGEYRLRHSLRLFAGYAVGGLGTSLLVVFYLAVRGGGLSSIFYGIENILSGIGYFSFRTVPPLKMFFRQLLESAYFLRHWVCLFLALVIIYAARQRLRHATGRADWPRVLFLCGWASYIVSLLLACASYLGASGDLYVMTVRICGPAFLMAPAVLWLVNQRHPACRSLFICLWFPLALWLVVTAFSAWDGFFIRCIALMGGQFCFLVFSALYVEDTFSAGRFTAPVRVFCAAACLFATVCSLYGYVYRDGAIPTLNHQLTEGVFKYLYTTEERSRSLPALEQELRAQVSPEDSVLFMDNVPIGYMMVEAQHCTPSTWDMSNYSYGRNDPSLYLNYFSVTGNIPDKIVYVHTGRDEHISMDEPGYLFNDFVNQYYTLTYRNDDSAFPVRVYTKAPAADLWQP